MARPRGLKGACAARCFSRASPGFLTKGIRSYPEDSMMFCCATSVHLSFPPLQRNESKVYSPSW